MNRRQAIGCLAAAMAPFLARAASITSHETVDERLSRLFADEGTSGAFAAYRVDGRQLILSDKARCDAAILPASTFKIANSIIALETGVLDPDEVRQIEGWNPRPAGQRPANEGGQADG